MNECDTMTFHCVINFVTYGTFAALPRKAADFDSLQTPGSKVVQGGVIDGSTMPYSDESTSIMCCDKVSAEKGSANILSDKSLC